MPNKLEHTPVRRAEIFSGNAHPELAEAVAADLNINLGSRVLDRFSNGEIRVRLEDSVRGKYVFVIQPHGGSLDPNLALAEQVLLCDAAKSGSAEKVIAICPYLGYERQDRKSQGRESIAAGMTCRALIAAGADGIVGIDLHASQIQGFIGGKPFDNLTAAPYLRSAILSDLEKGVVVVSPDTGGAKRAEGHSTRLPRELKADMAVIFKTRPNGTINQAVARGVMGDVNGRQCVLVDDIVDTGGTIAAAADLLRNRGAEEVLLMATHPILSGNAVETLSNAALKRTVVTNTLSLTPEQRAIPGLDVISIAPLIARAIHEIFTDGSISRIFDEHENHS